MLELYHFLSSTCSQKVRMCLAEKGLAWKDCELPGGSTDHLSDWYLKLNPNGVVPTLVHDGRPVIDSNVIMEYLDDVFPEVAMVPSDLYARALMRSWLRYFDEVTTPSIRYPSYNQVLVHAFPDLDEGAFREMLERRPVKKYFFRKMTKAGFGAEEMAAAMERLADALVRLDAGLAKGPWLMGEQFTIADACVLPTIDRLDDLGYADMWQGRHANVTAWYRRIRERPSYAAAYPPGARLTVAFQAA